MFNRQGPVSLPLIRVVPVGSLAAVFLLLEFGLPAWGVSSFIIPVPSSVISTLIEQMTSPVYWEQFIVTFIEIVAGLAIGASSGFVLGVLVTQSRLLEAILTPYLVALQAVPKIALAPVLVLVFGFGVTSKIVIAAILAFFPVYINVGVGIRSAEQDVLELMKQLRATRWQTLRWVSIPGAMPFVMASMRVATAFAILGAVVGEFTGAARGLGRLLIEYNYNFNSAGVFAVLVMMSVMAVILDQLVRMLSKRVIFWQEQEPVPGAT